jgi:DNA-binding NarL/FixJ family response regulator
MDGMTDSGSVTRVLVVEDQRTLAEALMIAIDAQPDLECAGAIESAEEALRLVAIRCPDVVLMDIHLPGINGIDGTRRIKAHHPHVRVFVLTADATPRMFDDATAAGASGFLAKNGPFPDILAAIRTPARSRTLVAGGTFAALLARHRSDTREPAPPVENRAGLTAREREVLTLMGEGLAARPIARRLAVTENTARGHIKRVLAKLHARSRQEAVAVAVRTGLLPRR